jgi:hypothetical protein
MQREKVVGEKGNLSDRVFLFKVFIVLPPEK